MVAIFCMNPVFSFAFAAFFSPRALVSPILSDLFYEDLVFVLGVLIDL